MESKAAHNLKLTMKTLNAVLAAGVREFCICAGARNAPLIAQLEITEGIRTFPFFDERSAAFFALGRMRSLNRPVAVVMTSGTAVAEALPAVIEAFYQGLPLLVLSADRPSRFRGTGAPQSIEQVGIFSSYVEKCLDLESESAEVEISGWSQLLPLHLNLCLEEPSGLQPTESLRASDQLPPPSSRHPQQNLHAFTLSKPVVIVGPLHEDEKKSVQDFLNQNEVPFVPEAPSALTLEPQTWKRRILCAEKTLPHGFQSKVLGSVLRLGGVPTLRFWRDLEEKFSSIPVSSCSNQKFSGLARDVSHLMGIENLAHLRIRDPMSFAFLDRDQETFERLLILLQKYPRSEQALVRDFALASHEDHVYLGNSLPIREWDLVSGDLPAPNVWANRGANGIDGQISSFLGWSQGVGPTAWALIGDLTALYDLSAPWISRALAPRSRRLCIINNFGGQIFRPLFKRDLFLNRHEINFEPWAAMWGWNYLSSKDGSIFKSSSLSHDQIIEIFPEEKSSEFFNQEWRAL
jgi:2-succinyl-5-enolpyruvyl-6-hydroxy-3-cyclohexene-1-carboxylate synthase